MAVSNKLQVVACAVTAECGDFGAAGTTSENAKRYNIYANDADYKLYFCNGFSLRMSPFGMMWSS
jgi:hypothetical protein